MLRGSCSFSLLFSAGMLALAGSTDAAAQAPAGGNRAVQRAPDSFAIEAFDVSGVTTLTAPEVERIVYPFAGPNRTIADVQAARKALQDAYIAKGYEAVLVDVPVQPSETFGRGIVQLAVTESPLGRVRVTGSKFHSLAVAREQVPSLAEGQPVNLKALQQDIASANRFPDRMINPSFRPGQVPGTIDVDLAVTDESPLHGRLELSNDHSPSTTSLRLSGTLRYTNLWQLGHSLSLTYLVAPQRRSDSEVFSGAYVAPLIGTPWTISLYGYKSNSNIAALGGANVLGDGYQIGLRAIYRLPGDRVSQTISVGPDFKNFKQDITIAGTPAGSAPIRYIPLAIDYALNSATEKSTLAVTLGTTVGLRVIKDVDCLTVVVNRPCVPVDQFRQREIDSNENFVHFNLGVDYSRVFGGDIVATARLAAQLADSHLVTNEQFAAGGLTNVRGYLLSEAVGDDGITGGIDLRSPSFATLFGAFVDEARVYAFADGGYIHVRSALPDQASDFYLTSIGAGGRIRLFDIFTGEALVAVPLHDGPVSSKGDPRFLFVARGEF